MFGIDALVEAGADWLMWEGQKDFSRENRKWMAEREDTAMQRRVQDLIAAGLNPMLAYTQGASSAASASQPHGFQPSSSMVAAQQRRLASAQAAKVEAETTLIESQRANIDADTSLKTSSAGQASAHARLLEAQIPEVMSRIRHLETQADLEEAKKALTSLETDKLRAILPSLIAIERGRAAKQGVGTESLEALNEVEREWFRFLESFALKLRGAVPHSGKSFKEFRKDWIYPGWFFRGHEEE